MKKLSLLLLLLVSISAAFGQKIRLFGTVTDEKDSALPGVTVLLSDSSKITTTDGAGQFEILADSGKHIVNLSRSGYLKKSIEVELTAEKRLDIKMALDTVSTAKVTGKENSTVVKVDTSGKSNMIYGIVSDEKDGSPLSDVVVMIKGSSSGAQTDTSGRYEIRVNPGTYTLEFNYVGYTKRSVLVSIFEQKEKRQDVKLTEEGKELDIVVVTGTKYEKKLSEEVVSMEVLKASVITQNNAKMDEAMNKVPGVNMLGKTISIRGGSGFADATGNRVLALLDEMPISKVGKRGV